MCMVGRNGSIGTNSENAMTSQRPLSPFETSYFSENAKLGSVPIGGMPLYIGSTVRGAVDTDVLRQVLGELAAAHPLLRSRILTGTDGSLSFYPDDNYRPRLLESSGGAAEYLKLVNTRPDWRDGLFHAQLLRDGDRSQIVLVIHHGIADGRSAFALLEQMWQHYTGHVTGSPVPQQVSEVLPEAVDARLATQISDAEVAELLEQIRTGAATMSPESAPWHLPKDGDVLGEDPLGRLAIARIELDTKETAALVAAARAHGLSVNSVLGGAALIAFRSQLEPNAGALPMMCGHAVDVRSELVPPLPASTMLNCASGAGTPVAVAPDAKAIELAHEVADGMKAAMLRGEPARFLLVAQRIEDEATAALLSTPPSFAMSNIGRVPAHPVPVGLSFVRDDIYAMAPGMPPKLTIFTVGDRLTIQVEHDTAEHSRTQLGKVAQVLIEQLQAIRFG